MKRMTNGLQRVMWNNGEPLLGLCHSFLLLLIIAECMITLDGGFQHSDALVARDMPSTERWPPQLIDS